MMNIGEIVDKCRNAFRNAFSEEAATAHDPPVIIPANTNERVLVNYLWINKDKSVLNLKKPQCAISMSHVQCAVVNANNVGAIDAARGMMGIGGLSTKDVLSGIAKDKQGFVANVDITNQAGKTNPYSVSLEAMTPSGKTALTPDEARKRSAANPANIALSAKQDESKKGIFSGVKSMAKNIFDSIFGDDEDTKQVESKAFGTMTVAAPKSGGVYDVFPDAPAAPKDTTPSRSQSESRGGLSDAARDAVDKGTGGLY